jgi:hypothetical protein
MSIAASGEYREPLSAAHNLAEMGVPIFCCRLGDDGNPRGAFDWQNTEAGDESHAAIERWRPGMGLGALGGVIFDIIDVDPRNGGDLSWRVLLRCLAGDPPEIFGIAATPSRGAHFYIASQGVGRQKLLKGIDLQARSGFVFIPPTVRPSKAAGDNGALRPYRWVSEVHWQATPWAHEPSAAFAMLPWSNGEPTGASSGSSRKTPAEWMETALTAETGEQRGALLGLVMEYMFRGMPDAAIADTLRNFLLKMPVFDEDRPWYPARGGNPDKWIHSLMRKSASFRPAPDADSDELEGIRDVEPRRITTEHAESAEEIAFWESRPVLAHIRTSARARRASPWAVLGEAMAEAVCHTPSTLLLPPVIGGEGTLNMLIAIVGKPGIGKNAAARAARAAFRWTGIMGIIDDKVDRIPIGSGEGIAKSYGMSMKNKETGVIEVARVAESVIFTIPEIDTFGALHGRSGSTLSPEMRKFYSGEALGFGYSNRESRVIIEDHTYRGCIIAGVQPGRGEVILGDMDSGFAQRWLWLPARDETMPRERPEMPRPMDWEPPGLVESLGYSDGPYVMPVFDGAWDLADEAIFNYHLQNDNDDDREAHAFYTRLKVAAGLALLDGSDELRESDWELSAYVMKVSGNTRDYVARVLAEKAAAANEAAGRSEGKRRAAAEASHTKTVNTKIAKRVLALLDYSEFRTYTKITMSGFNSADRSLVPDVLIELGLAGMVESENYTYRGRKSIRYRKIRKTK